jgi:drug/metabolite transporter (DMT)-like permease
MMADAVFLLCAATSLACAALLLRGYAHNRVRLLLWSSLCFVGLALNNVLLVVDFLILPHRDLSTIRHIPALVGMLLLVYGLIWDSE